MPPFNAFEHVLTLMDNFVNQISGKKMNFKMWLQGMHLDGIFTGKHANESSMQSICRNCGVFAPRPCRYEIHRCSNACCTHGDVCKNLQLIILDTSNHLYLPYKTVKCPESCKQMKAWVWSERNSENYKLGSHFSELMIRGMRLTYSSCSRGTIHLHPRWQTDPVRDGHLAFAFDFKFQVVLELSRSFNQNCWVCASGCWPSFLSYIASKSQIPDFGPLKHKTFFFF